MSEQFRLRTYAFINNMQPQYAAFTGTVIKGDIALAGMAQLYIEMSPGSSVYKLLDAAIKQSEAKPGFLIVEREYGEIELHSFSVDAVKEAGQAILREMGITEQQRMKPKVVSQQLITKVDSYQAQLINRSRQGSMLVPSETLFIMETTPAGYISIAANEAEKAANIKLIHFDPVGSYGRLYISGNESETKVAREAALTAIEQIIGIE